MRVMAVTESVPRAGSILMWTLSGTTDLTALAQALDEGGWRGPVPAPTSPASALRRAVAGLKSRDVLVHPVGRGNGFALVDVHHGQKAEDLAFTTRSTVTLDAVGRPVVRNTSSALAAQVREAFDAATDSLAPDEVSAWLIKCARSVLDGVAMRGNGGVYFVPHPRLDQLETLVSALRTCSKHSIYRIPAVAGDDAVQAILDAVEIEAKAEADNLEAALAKGLGLRGLQHRIERADEVALKVERYEALLGTKLEALRARLETLSSDLTVAMLTAKNKEEAAE